MLYYENKAKRNGYQFVIGVDEAGRGPLAGPVVAAAVSLKSRRFENRIYDSKRLRPLERERAFEEIRRKSAVGVGIIDEDIIDKDNILEATRQAMENAVFNLLANLFSKKELKKNKLSDKIFILVDGNHLSLNLPYKYKNIIAADTKSLSVASASIIAKVIRDRIMVIYDRLYPQYGFRKHKGYPTREHLKALRVNGPSKVHRASFGPVRCRIQD
jgi:ribonuclease HII